jgi:DNA recombination protein RmuC
MLRTAAYAWQQQALSENARAVFELGRELYDRLGGLSKHFERLGRSLTSAVGAYNQAVGSLESRVLVTARRMSDLGLTSAPLDSPPTVTETARSLAAAEMIAPDLVTAVLPPVLPDSQANGHELPDSEARP